MAKIYFTLPLLFLGLVSFGQQFSPHNIPSRHLLRIEKASSTFVGKTVEMANKINTTDPCGEKYIYFDEFDTVPMEGWTIISKSTNNVGNHDPKWKLRPFGSGPAALGLPSTADIDKLDNQVEVNEWLISPDIELPADKKYRFVFTWTTSTYWNAKQDPEGKYDLTDIEVKIAVGGGATDESSYDPAFYREDNQAKIEAGGIKWPYQTWEWYTSTYDLSAYAGKKINIAFHGISRPQGSVEFVVADMYFEEWPPNDLVLKDKIIYSGEQELGYTMIPLHQMAPISFKATFKNGGVAAQPNTKLDATVKDASGTIFNKKSSPILIEPFEDSVLHITDKNVFDPAGSVDTTKVLTVIEKIESDSTECIPGDNQGSLPIFYNDSIYARDMFSFTKRTDAALVNWSGSSGQPFRIGNLYEIFMTKNVPYIEIGIDEYTDFKEQLVYGQIHVWDDTKKLFTMLGDTEDYTLTENDLGSIVKLTLKSPVKVEKGDLLLVVAGHYGGPSDGSEDVYFMSSGKGIQGEILGFDPDKPTEHVSLVDPPVPVVRLNFGTPDVSVPEKDFIGASLNDFYPNPARENGFISYKVEQPSKIQFRIFETSGKIVKEWNEGLKLSGKYTSKVDLTELNSGLYFYSLVTEKGTITKRFSLIK